MYRRQPVVKCQYKYVYMLNAMMNICYKFCILCDSKLN